MADYQDLYIERLRRDGDTVEALGPDGWERVEAWTEALEVADGETETVEIVETARGPIVFGGIHDPRALSLRCPARAEAELGFGALPDLLRSKTVADIDAAMDRWVTLSTSSSPPIPKAPCCTGSPERCPTATRRI
ncbi:hypothetical protein GCM10029992_34080 [Glycomyces albus]